MLRFLPIFCLLFISKTFSSEPFTDTLITPKSYFFNRALDHLKDVKDVKDINELHRDNRWDPVNKEKWQRNMDGLIASLKDLIEFEEETISKLSNLKEYPDSGYLKIHDGKFKFLYKDLKGERNVDKSEWISLIIKNKKHYIENFQKMIVDFEEIDNSIDTKIDSRFMKFMFPDFLEKLIKLIPDYLKKKVDNLEVKFSINFEFENAWEIEGLEYEFDSYKRSIEIWKNKFYLFQIISENLDQKSIKIVLDKYFSYTDKNSIFKGFNAWFQAYQLDLISEAPDIECWLPLYYENLNKKVKSEKNIKERLKIKNMLNFLSTKKGFSEYCLEINNIEIQCLDLLKRYYAGEIDRGFWKKEIHSTLASVSISKDPTLSEDSLEQSPHKIKKKRNRKNKASSFSKVKKKDSESLNPILIGDEPSSSKFDLNSSLIQTDISSSSVQTSTDSEVTKELSISPEPAKLSLQDYLEEQSEKDIQQELEIHESTIAEFKEKKLQSLQLRNKSVPTINDTNHSLISFTVSKNLYETWNDIWIGKKFVKVDDFKTLMANLNFTWKSLKGSNNSFKHPTVKGKFNIHFPHPHNYIGRHSLALVRKFMENVLKWDFNKVFLKN